MTSPNDKTPESPNPDRDALHDRLLDQALGEVVGGERPPDLADRILAAVAEPESVSPHRKERVMSEKKRSVRPWILGGVAACLTVGVVAVFAVSKIQEARQTARSSEDFQKLESRTDTLRRALEESKSGQAPGAAHEMSEEPVITGTTATHDLHPVDNATSPVPLPAEKDAPGWQMPASAHEIAGEKRELGRTVWYSGDEGAIKLPSSTGGDQGQGP
ncbi:MAG: hypothetical protein JW818_15830, partial [Pirellulales bacterium]|nr:hypothetical protein [Pirellulales bacterium]